MRVDGAGLGVLGFYLHKTGWGAVSVHIRSCVRIASLMRLGSVTICEFPLFPFSPSKIGELSDIGNLFGTSEESCRFSVVTRRGRARCSACSLTYPVKVAGFFG